MVTVHVDIRELSGLPTDAFVPKASLRVAPAQRVVDAVEDYVLTENFLRVTVVDGIAEFDVPATEPGQALVINEDGFRGAGPRLVAIPDQTDVNYGDLVDLDPATLDPSVEPVAAWWAELNQMIVGAEIVGTDLILERENGSTFNAGSIVGAGGSGDVIGPASSVDNGLLRFDGTTGKLVQTVPGATINDSGVMTGVAISADSVIDGTTNHAFTAADDAKLAGIPPGGSSGAPTGLPAHAGTGRTGTYDPRLNVYNLKPENTRRIRAAMARTLDGGKMDILIEGDSLTIGANGVGTTAIEANALGERLAVYVANALGTVQAGSGVSPCVSFIGVLSDRWTKTGTVTIPSNFPIMSAAATMTFTSPHAGTNVSVLYSDLSPAFSYRVDGGVAINVPAGGGTNTINIHTSPTTYADTTHSVVITAASANTIPVAAIIDRTAGVASHSMGFGGATAGHPGNTDNAWTATADTNGIYVSRRLAWEETGKTADVKLICLGGNDMFQAPSDTAANAIAKLEIMVNWDLADTDVILCQSWEVPTTDATKWAEYCEAKYALADSLDIPLIDWRHRYGDAADLDALGMVGPDKIHPTAGTGFEMARMVADILQMRGD